MTIVFVLTDWIRYETFRQRPVSQVGYFFGALLIAGLGATLGWLALRRETGNRAAAMIAISAPLAANGAISSAAGRETAVWLFYAGAFGLAAGVVALAEAPRRAWLGLIGIVGAVLIFRALIVLNDIAEQLFP